MKYHFRSFTFLLPIDIGIRVRQQSLQSRGLRGVVPTNDILIADPSFKCTSSVPDAVNEISEKKVTPYAAHQINISTAAVGMLSSGSLSK